MWVSCGVKSMSLLYNTCMCKLIHSFNIEKNLVTSKQKYVDASLLFAVLVIWHTQGPCKGNRFLTWVLKMKQTQGPSKGTRFPMWLAGWLPPGEGTESGCTFPNGVRKSDLSNQWQRV